MSTFAFKLAFETPLKRLMPARVKNVIYRRYIEQLRRRAAKEVEPDTIFATSPLPCDRNSSYKVWMVSSAKDTTMAFWALKSLLHFSRVTWDVWLADGGLLPLQIDLFERHFPGIRVLHKTKLDEHTRLSLRRFPQCHDLRHERGFALALKLIDPPFHLSGRFLLLDSDVLFFANPEEIIAAIADDHVPFHFNMESGAINSGVAVVDPQAVQLEDIEAHLSAISRRQRKRWTVEQDAYIALAKNHFAPLPGTYAVEPIGEAEHGLVTCCHYIGVVRHRFYERGIRRLRQQGFLGIPAVAN